jgi:hypothetical protein
MKDAGHVACMREIEIAFNITVRKHEGNKSFGRSRHGLAFSGTHLVYK